MSDISEILNSVASNPDLLNKISNVVKDEGNDMSKSLSEVIALISDAQKENNDDPSQDNDNGNEVDKKSTSSDAKEEATLKGLNLDELFSSKEKGGLEGLILSLGKGISTSSALLIALKPFLSKSRQDLIEKIINLSKLSSLASLVK